MSFDQPTEQKTGNLKVLTLLTFIGSGISLLFTAFTPVITNFSKKMMDAATNSGKELSPKDLEKIEEGRKAIALTEANQVPIMVVGILSAIACIIGAMWMRKLKKDGFYVYVAGEILPLIAGFILMGTAMFTGVMSVIMGVGIPVVFIILYANHLKYLTK